jgi:hypothetical protein
MNLDRVRGLDFRDKPNAHDRVLDAKDYAVVLRQLLVIRDEAVVGVDFAGMVGVAVNALRDPGLIGFLEQ